MDDFSQKEIITRIWNETQKQSDVLSALVSEVKAIKEQTTKTNGRVTKLEGQTHDIETQLHNVERVQEGLLVKIGGVTLIATLVISEFVRKFL